MRTKTITSLLSFLILALFSYIPGNSQCAVTNPVGGVTQQTVSGSSCITIATYTFNYDANFGNKYAYGAVYAGSSAPTVAFTAAPTISELTNGGTVTPLFSFQLDNEAIQTAISGTGGLGNFTQANETLQHAIFVNSYLPDPTGSTTINFESEVNVPAIYLTVANTATNGVYQYTIHNLVVKTPAPCGQITSLTGLSWGTQANSNNPHTHCFLSAPGGVTQGTIYTSINCNSAGSTYTFAFNTPDATQHSFTWAVYADANASHDYDAGDVKISAATNASVGPVTSYSLSPAGAIPTTYQYSDLFLLVYMDGATTPTVYRMVNECQTILPVNFGEINTQKNNGQLLVSFQSLKEINCDKYVLEASKDGVVWKEISTVKSKSVNGTSDGPIEYSFSANVSLLLGGLSLAFLLISVFKSRILRFAMMMMAIGILGSCLKNGKEMAISKDESTYIRIAQHDLDGKVHYSKIIKIVDN